MTSHRTSLGVVRAVGVSTAIAMVVVLAALPGCSRAPEPNAAISVKRQIGEGGLQPGQFAYPRAIAAHDRWLFVVDKSARIQRIDANTGKVVAHWRTPESALGKPTGITVAPGPDGSPALYVADTHYHRVLIYDIPSEPAAPHPLIAQFGKLGEEPGQLGWVTDVAVQTDDQGLPERIFVSEYGGADKVSVFDADHNFLFRFGAFGAGDDAQFDRPQSIALTPDQSELIIADSCNHRVGRFTTDGELIAWVGGPEMFTYPYGLEMLTDGTVLVAEFGAGRIHHLDLNTGATLGAYGQPGRGAGQLAQPWGISAIGKTAFVLDSGNNRVLSFRCPGGGGSGGGLF